VGAHLLAPRIQDDHESDFDITLFSHYLIENPLNPRVFGSWIRSSEPGAWQSARTRQAVVPRRLSTRRGTVLVDGFKRLRAARSLKGKPTLQARFLKIDEQAAKAAIFNLNRITSTPNELEEAWIIFALVHEDQLPQSEVAQLLGRHRSWINEVARWWLAEVADTRIHGATKKNAAGTSRRGTAASAAVASLAIRHGSSRLSNRRDGWHDPTSQVPDSNEARHYISKRRRDILLSNMEMLGVHGIEMLKLARNDGRVPFAVL
jgi:hypothetical protein